MVMYYTDMVGAAASVPPAARAAPGSRPNRERERGRVTTSSQPPVPTS